MNLRRRAISIEESSFEWSSWLREKSTNVLRELARIAKVVETEEALLRTDILDIREHLSLAIHDAVKLVSFSAGYVHDGPGACDVERGILKNSDEALEEFLFQVGVIRETTRTREAREVGEVLHRILPLLDGPRGGNRTMIHEVVEGYGGRSVIVYTLRALTEKVTNGELTWDEYCAKSRTAIAAHECSAP